MALAALLATVKHTLFLYAGVLVVTATVYVGWTRSWRAAAAVPALYGLFFVGIWAAAGQSPSNILVYARNFDEVAWGYTEAMALRSDEPSKYQELCLGAGCTAAAALFFTLSAWGCPLRRRRLLQAAVVGAAWFIAWKNGFVRLDAHAYFFFVFALSAAFLIRDAAETRPRLRRAQTIGAALVLTAAATGLCSAGKELGFQPRSAVTSWKNRLAENLGRLWAPRRYAEQETARLRAGAQQFGLPSIARTVGAASVDLLGHEQGWLLFNGLRWHPRPVFQSYAAYTPRLLELNAEFYRRADAPRYVLFKLQTIDERLPAADDGPALVELRRRYEPILTESGILLLRRRAEGDAAAYPAATPLLSRDLRFGEWVDLDGWQGYRLLAALTVRPSFLGRVRRFLYRPPYVHLDLELSDGKVYSPRVVPGIVSGPFILQPVLRQTDDFSALYRGEKGTTIRRLRLTTFPGAEKYFLEPLHVELTGFPRASLPAETPPPAANRPGANGIELLRSSAHRTDAGQLSPSSSR